MSNTIEFDSMDMFDCRALKGKYAKVFIRKGKCFMYIDDKRYNINDVKEEDKSSTETIIPGVETVNVSFSKDFSYEGEIVYMENAEGYVVGIANLAKKANPLTIIRMAPRPVIN